MSWRAYRGESKPVEPLWSQEACRARIRQVFEGMRADPVDIVPIATSFWDKAYLYLSTQDLERAVATDSELTRQWEALLAGEYADVRDTYYARLAECHEPPRQVAVFVCRR